MSEDRSPDVEPAQEPEPFEPPAIVAIGKLDQVTFGAPAATPLEGGSSYL
ncbi:MAG TPA: hypothetical protein VGW10_09185 [Solirubrobacteraceae bacterium]|nr:hypothetical protein [Solirubrobacteraceae bacterium]